MCIDKRHDEYTPETSLAFGVFLYKFDGVLRVFRRDEETIQTAPSSNQNSFCATQDELRALRPVTITEHRNPKPNTLGVQVGIFFSLIGAIDGVQRYSISSALPNILMRKCLMQKSKLQYFC